MPIYEYECDKCGTFEFSQRITDSPLKRCPACKGKVKKLISSTSFQLKGTGWYVTDYAGKDAGGKKAKSDDKADTSASKDSKDSKESTAEKPAAKKEAKSEASAA